MRVWKKALWVLLMVGFGAGTGYSKSLWIEDFEAAKRLSTQTGKPILVDITGQDWCPPCMKMEEEVFSKPEFATQAGAKYVLLRLDYPKKTKQDDKIRAQNQRLAELYPFTGVPTYYLLDGKGRPFGVYSGYVPGGVKAFLALTTKLEGQKIRLNALSKAADAAPSGNAKAKALHELFTQAETFDLAFFYSDVPARIIAEDKDNKAGLKLRYQISAEYTHLLNTWTEKSDFQKAARDTEALATRAKPYPDLEQTVTFTLAMIRLNALNDNPGARKALNRVRQIDPQSAVAVRAQEILDRLP